MTISRRTWSRLRSTVITLGAALLLAPMAQATFTVGKGAVTDKPCQFQRTFRWDFPATGADTAPAGLGGGSSANWVVPSLTSPTPTTAGSRDLTLITRHLAGTKACDQLHAASGSPVTLTFTGITRPAKGKTPLIRAYRIPHGTHADYFVATLIVPATGNVGLVVQGQHLTKVPASASFQNLTSKPLNVKIYPTYRGPQGQVTEGEAIDLGTVKGKQPKKNIELPTDDNGNPATDYRVEATGSALSDTTLAFLGAVEGVAGVAELELAPMIEMLGDPTPTGGAQFFAPMLRDPAEALDLYVFVDLTRWVGSRAVYEPLDVYSVAGGVHPDLPGYFVSTSPITLGSDGSPSGTPYTGELFVGATIDGSKVPPTETCRFGPQPAATLLVPYFETDLQSSEGVTTLFAIDNAAEACTLARVTLWTDLAIPTLTFYVYLSPHDVQTINLRDVFNGRLPDTSAALENPECQIEGVSLCAAGDLRFTPTPQAWAALRADHTGAPNPLTGDCAGVDRGDAVAVGFITVDAAAACTFPPTVATYEVYSAAITDPNTLFFAMDNHLWGDYFYANTGENFAQSEPAVHILADPQRLGDGDYTFYGRFTGFDGSDARIPLSSAWATRFLIGGGFDGGTDLLVWREPPTGEITRLPCGLLPPWAPLGHAAVTGFDEDEVPFTPSPGLAFPWATQRLSLIDLVPVPFGWLSLDLSLGEDLPSQAWVTPVMSALGRFSIGHTPVRLDDLCGAVPALGAPPIPQGQ